ncbi:MAG: iron-sulfur cluster-binding domain-containing protein [Deltaproteobacteria bacterium]|nr:iron-sulfur cluster-binding domain-containing protein [Deltaproteobacteria bacterium]
MRSDWLCLLEDLATYAEPLRRLGRRQLPAPETHSELLGKSRALVNALHPRSMRLRLAENLEVTRSTRTLRFERVDGELPPFRPGQYVSLSVSIGEVSTSRPYSISSPPGIGTLDLTVKREPQGFVSPWLCDREPGWEASSSGPAGSFVHEPLRDRGPLVLLSGGSGITPFMSMLQHFAAVGFPGKTTLLHNSRSTDDVIFGDAVASLARDHEDFDAVSVISRPPADYTGVSGHLDAQLIRERVGELDGASFFVCGPDGLIRHVEEQLALLDVPAHAIRREAFGPPADVTVMPEWPQGIGSDDTFSVSLVGGQTLYARAGEPLLNSLERAGEVIPAVCRTGECADCRMKVVSGDAWSLPGAGVREADRAQGFVHACVAYPTSDLRLDRG